MTIWERVDAALSGLGVPIFANAYVSATGTDYPDLYLVYFLVTAPPVLHADNSENLRDNLVQISVYYRGEVVVMPDVESAMLAAGFTAGTRRDLPYNKDTRHLGLMFEFSYLEERN